MLRIRNDTILEDAETARYLGGKRQEQDNVGKVVVARDNEPLVLFKS